MSSREPILKTLLISDLVDSTRLVEELGDRRAADLFRRHDRMARDLLARHGGREIDKTDGFLHLFERPIEAVLYAVEYHRQMRQLGGKRGRQIAARIGIHLAEVLLLENSPEDIARGAKPLEVEGLAKPVCARLMSVAGAAQTLLTRSAFDVARRGALDIDLQQDLTWLAHGGFRLKGLPEPVDLFEVGEPGIAPLARPADSEKVRRVDEQAEIAGWRPAPGIEIPQRPRWQLSERLGEGGFGEVWLAHHRKTGDQRVFKFCYDANSLRSLQREITLLRLLKEKLGERPDIVRVLDWDFESPPYFIEMEHCEEGSLLDFAQDDGLTALTLGSRLEIVAQVAEALAAAHSVGVLHKDVKPGNILLSTGESSEALQVRLGDFGVGLLTESGHLEDAGITVLGMTLSTVDLSTSGTAGTRLYSAPEVLEGKTPTLRADIYALGVVLFQMVVGDFSRVLAPGWRREIEDPLLAEDIAAAVDGSPEQRLGDALELATRLRSLEQRRRAIEAAASEKRQAEAFRQAEVQWRRRRRWWTLALSSALLLVLLMGGMAWRVAREAERANREAATAEQVTTFLSDLFDASDPFSVSAADDPVGRETPIGDVLDRGAARLQHDLAEQPAVQARLAGTLGGVYLQLGDYEAATPLLESAVAEQRRQFDVLPAEGTSVDAPPSHGLDSLRDLALLRQAQGDLESAGELLRQTLAWDRLGEPDESLAATLQDYGILLRLQGDYPAAAEALAESVEIRRQVLGEEHALVGTSLHGLAMVHQAAGDLEEAETVFRQSIAISRQALGEHHPRLVHSLVNLGTVLQMRGDYAAAVPLLEEALAVNRQTLGEDHPSTFITLNNLAILRLVQGELEIAEPLTLEALAMTRQFHGDSHPMVATVYNNLGFLLHGLGRYDESEAAYHRSLDIRLELFGEQHDVVASTYNNLARLAWVRGNFEAGETLIRRALGIFEATLSGDHWRLANARSLLGGCLLGQGQRQAAEPLLRDSVDVIVQTTGEASPYSVEARQRLEQLDRDPEGTP